MKLGFVIFSLLISTVILQGVCDKPEVYKCAELILMKDKCELWNTTEGNNTHYLSNCGKEETCELSGKDGLLSQQPKIFGYCRKRIPRLVRWEGEKANYQEECLSKMIEDKICIALNDTVNCKNNEDGCKNKSFCNKNTWECQKLLSEGEQCTSDYECDFPLLCGKDDKDSLTRKCIKMFTLEKGTFTTDPYLCRSGFSAEKSSGASNEYCAESETEADNCTDSTDCVGTITFAEGETIENQVDCICSASGKQGYCDITTNKDEYKDSLQTLSDYMNNTIFEDTDNIVELRNMKINPILSGKVPSYWGSPKVYQAQINILNYAKLKDADKCAIRKLSSSSLIKYPLFLLLSLILLA